MYKGWSRRNEVSTDLAPDRDLDEVGHDIAPLFRPASLLTRPVDPTIEFMKTTAIGVRKNAGFREFLQRKLAQSCANNPQYSLRAFAKSLGTDHSTLSQILRGKRRLTAETIRALARQLKLSDNDAEAFVACELRVHGDGGWERHVRQLRDEAMEIISQWHHFAILELVRLECFRPDCRWIARVLDLSVDDVNTALTRLMHLGLLQMVDQETWLDLSENAYAQFDRLPQAAAQKLMSRICRMASSGQDDHLLSSSTIAIDRNRIAVVSNYLEKVRREMADLLQGGSAACDDVFQLDIFFYPLTTLHKENENGEPGNSVPDNLEGP